MAQLRATTLLAALALLIPAGAFADGPGDAPQPPAPPPSGAPRPPPPPPGPGYPPGYGYPGYARPYPGYGYYAPPPRYAPPPPPAPYAYGWGIRPWGYYGYGYSPYFGGPMVAQQANMQPPAISSSIFLGGMASNQGGGLDLRGLIEGHRFGADFDLASLPIWDGRGDTSELPFFSGHVTYSFVSNLHLRVRAEAGVTAIRVPGVSYVGPDVGVSGQLALLGPLGIDAAVHWTPVAADILDADAGLALHFGNLGIHGGWRVMRIDDTHTDDVVGVEVISGPTVSVGLVF